MRRCQVEEIHAGDQKQWLPLEHAIHPIGRHHVEDKAPC
jgi:hypothetical protein